MDVGFEREETGVEVNLTGLIGLYTNPNHVVEYSDGEFRQQFSICFRAEYVGGEPTPGDESSAVAWVQSGGPKRLPTHPSKRLRIEHGFERRLQPYIG
ncbi:NUDIX hydrolase [Micromonospora sediminimaris]|uniref:NUDIX hydrolase n=1 Tax=Micromonospora sediminimaris TaxID=547162 RepID=UPI00379AE27A